MNQTTKNEYDFFKLMNRFISASQKGKRLQKDGKRISKDSIVNYSFLQKHLSGFSEKHHFHLRLRILKKINKRGFKAEEKYWKDFYLKFSHYLYDEMGHYDNYAGSLFKLLRSFFNYVNDELGLNIGNFHKHFYAMHEAVQIVVLSPERLNFLISDKEFEQKLSERLQRIKDIFVFGCTVALRFSDLMNLKETNLESINDRVYLSVNSKKTQTFTRVKLPKYAIDIIDKYREKGIYLIPRISNSNLNNSIKEVMELAGWTEPVIKTRKKRGVPVVIYRDTKNKLHYRFCDMVTAHTMRRTAITNMLCLGMPDQLVRKISGHAANSKEFYRYVNYSQAYLDTEIDMVFEKLSQKKLFPVEN